MTDKEAMQMALETAEQIASADYRHWGELASLGEFERWARSRANHIAEALRARLAQPEPAECDGGQCGIGGYCKQCPKTQPEQEPVAWADKVDIDRDGHDLWVSRQKPAKDGVPLYTAPPQREWVGLTDEEIREGNKDSWVTRQAWESAAWWAEAKLKEKNT